LIAAVVVLLVPSAVSSAANAASCPAGGSGTYTSPVATTSFDWQECGNNITITNGVLHDVLCDSRQGTVYFSTEFYSGTWQEIAGSKSYSVSSGCGNSASYPSITLKNRTQYIGQDCSTCSHRIRIHLMACNGGVPACSSDYSSYISYKYH
jgi:hypothetical protein